MSALTKQILSTVASARWATDKPIAQSCLAEADQTPAVLRCRVRQLREASRRIPKRLCKCWVDLVVVEDNIGVEVQFKPLSFQEQARSAFRAAPAPSYARRRCIRPSPGQARTYNASAVEKTRGPTVSHASIISAVENASMDVVGGSLVVVTPYAR